MQVLIILTTPNLRHTFLLHMQCSYVCICNSYANYEKRHYKICPLNLHIKNIRNKKIIQDVTKHEETFEFNELLLNFKMNEIIVLPNPLNYLLVYLIIYS